MNLYDTLYDDTREIPDGRDAADLTLSSPLASSRSFEISLNAIISRDAGLNQRRQGLLNRVPNPNEYCSLALGSVEIKDLAYLSAETGDEFALFRGKNEDILAHGSKGKCEIENTTRNDHEHRYSESLLDALTSGKLRLIAHSHPDKERIIASDEDREFLKAIGQDKSIIISWYTGRQAEFSVDRFQ